MVPPVRWYYTLSCWVFLLSIFNPILNLPMYPLVVLCSVGIFEIFLNPNKTNLLKIFAILFIHIAPFTWIPYNFSGAALQFSAIVITLYLLLLTILKENPIHIYSEVLKESHPTFYDLLHDRFEFI
jgi:predicted membrane protein